MIAVSNPGPASRRRSAGPTGYSRLVRRRPVQPVTLSRVLANLRAYARRRRRRGRAALFSLCVEVGQHRLASWQARCGRCAGCASRRRPLAVERQRAVSHDQSEWQCPAPSPTADTALSWPCDDLVRLVPGGQKACRRPARPITVGDERFQCSAQALPAGRVVRLPNASWKACSGRLGAGNACCAAPLRGRDEQGRNGK